MIWKCKRRALDLTNRGLIMGVLNVTPDSFSDGGSYIDPQAALQQARHLIGEGAEIIDIGGESTRPGAASVTAEEEIQRVIPVIRSVRQESDVLISIDTSKAAVAEAAMAEGADIINDVTALSDPAMPEVAIRAEAGVVLMHMQGTPRTMQAAPHYEDVVGEVGDFLRHRMASAIGCGMAVERIALDPGIGFGKRLEHNHALLAGTKTLAALGRPLLIGVSRKSFLGGEIESRFWPGVALTSFCRELGARIFRVHEPRPHHEALRMTEAILHGV